MAAAPEFARVDADGYEIINAGAPLDIQRIAQRQRDLIDQTPVKIAVTGETRTGKSMLINTMRGMKYTPPPRHGRGGPPSPKPHDPHGAARVGVNETTLEPTEYHFPGSEYVSLVDLPGINTPNFPARLVRLETYDMAIIVYSFTLHENDIALAKIFHAAGKPFWFVRSKIDVDLQNFKEDTNDDQELSEAEVEAVKQSMRDNLVQQLPSYLTPEIAAAHSDVFLVYGKLAGLDMHDMPRLRAEMLQVLPSVKRNALMLRMQSFLPDVIRAKGRILRSSITAIVALSAAAAAVPVPGLSASIDLGAVLGFAKNAASSFGLTSDRARLAFPDQHLRATVIGFLTADGVKNFLSGNARYLVLNVMEEYIRFLGPVGLMFATAISAGTMYWALNSIVDKLEQWAIEISEKILASAE